MHIHSYSPSHSPCGQKYKDPELWIQNNSVRIRILLATFQVVPDPDQSGRGFGELWFFEIFKDLTENLYTILRISNLMLTS
jgi:hypothetical protein